MRTASSIAGILQRPNTAVGISLIPVRISRVMEHGFPAQASVLFSTSALIAPISCAKAMHA
jgi:hypothetical protein